MNVKKEELLITLYNGILRITRSEFSSERSFSFYDGEKGSVFFQLVNEDLKKVRAFLEEK